MALNNISPLQLLREAIRAVPALKYALGIVGIVAAIAIIRALTIKPQFAYLGILMMLLLMTLLVLFAYISKMKESYIHTPALIMVYFIIVVTIAGSTFLFTSVFFQWPRNLSYWISNPSYVPENVGENEAILTLMPEGDADVFGDLKIKLLSISNPDGQSKYSVNAVVSSQGLPSLPIQQKPAGYKTIYKGKGHYEYGIEILDIKEGLATFRATRTP